jgi:fatty acid desaturase
MEEEKLPAEVIEHRNMEKMFQENGMYKTNYWFYYRLGMILFTLFCTAIYGVVCCESKTIHMLSAVLLGFVFNQFSFIGHDTGHNGITKNRKIDNLIG